MNRFGCSHILNFSYPLLEKYYEDRYPQAPYTNSPYLTNENEVFSFNWNMFVYFYVDMYFLSGHQNKKWLDLAIGMCDHFLKYADNERVARGELTILPRTEPIGDNQYYQAQQPYLLDEGDFIAGAPGWSSFDLSPSNLSIQILQDGQILGSISYLVECLLSNDLAEYEEKANIYLDKIQSVIDSHEWSWRYNKVAGVPAGYNVAGNWWYPNRVGGIQSGTLPFNHCAGALQSMIIFNKYRPNPEYINKFNAFMDFSRSDFGGDYFARRDLTDRYWFPYNARRNTSYEDLNHGSYILTMYKVAIDNNLGGFSTQELKKYAKSALNAWSENGFGIVGERFGVLLESSPFEEIPVAESFDPLHFSWLNQYCDNNEIFKMCRDLSAVNGSKSGVTDSRRLRGLSQLLINKPTNVIY